MTYITEAMVYNSLKYQMNRSQTTMYEKVEQASSGRRINSAEDDPNGAAIVAEYDDQLYQLQGMKRVSIDVNARVMATENALKSINTLLGKAQIKLQEGINAANGSEQQKIIAQDVAALQAEMLQSANAVTNDRYIFGGFLDNAAPFDINGTYTGDGNVARAQVAPSLWVDMNVPGNTVINTYDATLNPNGLNILGAMGKIVTALNTGDIQGMQDGLSNIRKGIDQVAQGMASLNAPEQTLNYSEQLRNDLTLSLQEQRTAYADVDALQAFSELMQAQSTMQAAIMVSQQVIATSNRSLDV